MNPLRGFTIQRAVTLLEDGERGAYADLQWAFRFAEKRNATLRALKRLRLAAIGKLDWDIKRVDDSRAAKRQQERIRAAYDRIENLREAIRFTALAEFRGFSHLEKRYEGDNPTNDVVRLEPVEQWFWCRDTSLGEWQYNATAQNTTRGEPVELQHFIVREVDDPIDEIGLLAHAAEGLGKKDYAGFIETYGLPPIFGELPPDTADATKVAQYQAMMEAVIGDMRGTIPSGAKIHTVGDGVRGVNPFREFLDTIREEIVLAGTSGKLTMLNGPTGLGGGQSEVHQDTFDELAQAEAAEISELFQRHFDEVILEREFGGQPCLAYFEIAAKDQVDVGQVLDHAVKAKQAGVRIETTELAEKTGYTLVDEPPPVPPTFGGLPFGGPPQGTPLQIANRMVRNATKAKQIEALAAAQRETFAPLLDKLEEIRDAKDPGAYADAVARFRDEVKRLGPKMVADPKLAAALQGILAEAAAEGAVETLEKRT